MTSRKMIVLAWAASFACQPRASLPILGKVAPFSLTQQSGVTFDSASLRGHVWVADFIYTNCPGPCPLMSERMRRIQNVTPPALRLVSFSVDPVRDTPPALDRYARRFGALDNRWTFLTGDASILNRLDRDDFHLGTLDGSFSHSTRFVLMDGQGRIRAYYSYGDDGMVQNVVRDALELIKENS